MHDLNSVLHTWWAPAQLIKFLSLQKLSKQWEWQRQRKLGKCRDFPPSLGTRGDILLVLFRSSSESRKTVLALSVAPAVGQHNFVIVFALHYRQPGSNSCCCSLIYWISENSIRPGQGFAFCSAAGNPIKLRGLQLQLQL